MPDPLAASLLGGPGIWLVALALAPLTAFFLVLSALLERSGPIRLRHWAEEAGRPLRSVYDNPARFEVFRFLLNLGARLSLLTLMLVLVSALGGLTLSLAVIGGFLAVVLLATGIELLNRSLVGSDPEPALRRLTSAYRVMLWLLRPLVTLLAPLVPRRRADDGADDDDEQAGISAEEIEAFIDVGKREGILEGPEEDLVRSVVDFGDTLVRTVMTPRTAMICAPVGSTLDEMADLFLLSKHSRIPLHQGSIDHVVGVLHIRDLLAALRSDPRPTAASIAKAPFVVPETKPLSELLRELQGRHLQLAMVVDEHGGIAGLVTIEDLLEEIVGDIVDEHEELPPVCEVVAEGVFRLDGKAPVDVLDDLFGLDVADEPTETVGGLVFAALGTVPKMGDSVLVRGLRFTVVGVDQRRVSRVEVTRAAAGAGASEEGTE